MNDLTTEIGRFWANVNFDGDAKGERLALLREFGRVRVPRQPGDPTPDQVRAQSRAEPLPSRRCFACRDERRALQAHHVIEVQNGGTNTTGNRVSLCVSCHCALHPWMKRSVSKYYSRRDRGSQEWCSPNPALRVTPLNWVEPEDEPEGDSWHGYF